MGRWVGGWAAIGRSAGLSGWTRPDPGTRLRNVSQLDQELAKAVAEGEQAEVAPVARVVSDGDGRATAGKRSLGLVAMLLLLGGGMLVLVLTSFKSSVVYSKGVDELLAEADRLTGRSVRVEGTLVKGSLQRREEPCEYRFLLERNGAKLSIEYPQCSVPDTFRDVPYTDVKVTAEGRLAKSGHFEATQIMAKCPSKYEGGDSAMGGPKRESPGAQSAAN